MDAGFCDKKIYQTCEELGIGYLSSGRLLEEIRKEAEGRSEGQWSTYRNDLDSTTVGDEDFDDDLVDEVAGSINYDDFALSGGAGAGADIRLYHPDNPKKNIRAACRRKLAPLGGPNRAMVEADRSSV